MLELVDLVRRPIHVNNMKIINEINKRNISFNYLLNYNNDNNNNNSNNSDFYSFFILIFYFLFVYSLTDKQR
jgi:hypothetical protein